MDARELIAIIGSVLGVGLALAMLIMRTTGRIDADRRELQRAMETFRVEMQRLAEWQSHVEGRLEERGSAAD